VAVLHPPAFDLDIVPDRQQVTVRVAGELDIATGPRLHDAVENLRACGWSAIALDLGDLTFIDSTGLALLLELCGVAGGDSGEVAVAVSCPALERLLTVSKLEHALPRR
jgi:anti-sigma B factor antagonist